MGCRPGGSLALGFPAVGWFFGGGLLGSCGGGVALVVDSSGSMTAAGRPTIEAVIGAVVEDAEQRVLLCLIDGERPSRLDVHPRSGVPAVLPGSGGSRSRGLSLLRPVRPCGDGNQGVLRSRDRWRSPRVVATTSRVRRTPMIRPTAQMIHVETASVALSCLAVVAADPLPMARAQLCPTVGSTTASSSSTFTPGVAAITVGVDPCLNRSRS